MFRLKELRLENGLKRSDLARKLELPPSTIANYENETRQAPYDVLTLFADFFDVSVDYLLGRTDEFNHRRAISLSDAPLSNAEKELIACYRALSATGKSRMDEYARMLKDFHRKA